MLADVAGLAHVAIKGGFDAGHAVDFGAWVSSEAIGDFQLHHHENALQRGVQLQDMQ